MTFAPGLPSRFGMPSAIRTFLFWCFIFFLLLALLQVALKMTDNNVSAISYSDFMQQVDQKNVASITLSTSQSTAEVHGEFRQSANGFRVAIPNEVIPALTDRLRNQGVPIEASAAGKHGWTGLVLNLAPFLILIAFWFMVLRPKRIKPDQSLPSDLSNRPIG
jgi:ATP-dependent Zn protease